MLVALLLRRAVGVQAWIKQGKGKFIEMQGFQKKITLPDGKEFECQDCPCGHTVEPPAKGGGKGGDLSWYCPEGGNVWPLQVGNVAHTRWGIEGEGEIAGSDAART